MHINKKYVLLIMIMGLFAASCAGPKITIENDTVYEQPVEVVQSEYLIGPGDKIELMYHILESPVDREYTLNVGDVVKVEFYSHPDMNRQVAIRPDGNITLPLKGDIFALGLTPAELSETIEEFYGDTLREPMVTVTLIDFNVAIRELKNEITSLSRGQSKIVTVRPDGFVNFPLIDDIKAAGLTLTELKSRVETRYKEINSSLSVSLLLEEMRSNVAYIMGEVKNPGMYLMERPVSITQLLAEAGGELYTAELSTIIVISRRRDGRPMGRLVNLDRAIGEANIGNDILLRQYDVVYVPRTAITKADIFIEQYINRLIPNVFRGAGVTFGYDLHRERPED